ncbi:hypothetical protein AB0K09_24380 [Streptomyces sp. NPDC049577]|uniref:hypothetical protein n=1 Tax=Streptomyces sp. NPDC049577 TaxID=3155153 RepID=UPI00341B652E
MTAYFGPLERTAGQWVVGDPQRKGGAHPALSPEGLRALVAGEEQELVLWRRFMEVSTEVTVHRWSGSRTAALLNVLFGEGDGGVNGNGSRLTGMVGFPYEIGSGDALETALRLEGV